MNNINWVIVGGESGQSARPAQFDWIRNLRDQCCDRVPFFFKQYGQFKPVMNSDDVTYTMQRVRSKYDAGRILEGRTWDEYPIVGDNLPVIE